MPAWWRSRCTIALVLLAANGAAAWGESDFAVIEAARPVAVQISGRQAIIGWNGREEVIILATSFSAGGKATVLQAFPLPDLPSQIAAARGESFWAVQGMIAQQDSRRAVGAEGGPALPPSRAGPAVQIAHYDPATARDRAIITPEDADGFLTEAAAFAARQGGRLSAADGRALRAMAARYLRAGYRHFALEVIGLTRGAHTIGPISYRFRSDALFFPISPTALSAPPRDLQLFLLTRFELQPQTLPPGLRLMSYQDRSPIGFAISRDDALRISGTIAELFSASDEVVLTATALGASERARDLVLRGQPQPASRQHEAVSQPPPGGSSGGRGGGLPARPESRPGEALVVRGLAWSPAGDRLCVMESRMGGGREPVEAAVLLDLAKASRREVALSGWLSSQGWSPDGKQLAFLDRLGNIQVVDVDHDWAHQVTGFTGSLLGVTARGDPEGLSPPAWSASGEWLAFGAFANVWVVGRDGRGLRQLTSITEGDGSFQVGMGGGRGGSGMRGQPAPPPPRAWSPHREVLAYGQPEAEGDTWSVQGYEPETGRPAPVRGDLGLKGVRALAWQPGGGQLAVVGVGPMGRQTIYLIPQQGAIRELPTDLASVEAMWTGDGRTLLIRGGTSGTQRLTIRAVDAARGTVRTLAPTHFLADPDVTIVAARPASDDIAFALGTGVYLAHADGSGWRRLRRDGPVTVRPMENPLARWQRDPVVLEAVRRFQRAISRNAGEMRRDDLVYGIWDRFPDQWKARLLAGAHVSYRDLPQDLQREVLTGLVYCTHTTSADAGPGASTVPEWYWWLDEARLGLAAPDRQTLSLTLDGPEGAAHLFMVSRRNRRARSAVPNRLWWPALFGAAAVVVALLGWRQRRREREHPPEPGGPGSFH